MRSFSPLAPLSSTYVQWEEQTMYLLANYVSIQLANGLDTRMSA